MWKIVEIWSSYLRFIVLPWDKKWIRKNSAFSLGQTFRQGSSMSWAAFLASPGWKTQALIWVSLLYRDDRRNEALPMRKGELWGNCKGGNKVLCQKRGRKSWSKWLPKLFQLTPCSYLNPPPLIVCEEMDALIVDFWWGNTGRAWKIHWVSNEALGFPKQLGGMGFRNFQEFNDALLAK